MFRGGSPFNLEPDFTDHQGSFLTAFGSPVAVGDVNGDGAGDFLVSETFGGDFFNPEGQVYLYLGDTSFVVSIDPESKIVPSSFLTLQSYPNPFNVSANINYFISERGLVRLDIYNIRGESILSLVDHVQNEGKYEIKFDGGRLSSGIYFALLRFKGNYKTVKLLLLK